jgi:hypothetical protein
MVQSSPNYYNEEEKRERKRKKDMSPAAATV